MWTPRRMMLGLGGLAAFVVVYLGYTAVLGGFDGLPPLPERFRPSAKPFESIPSQPLSQSALHRRLDLAFGPGCRETRFPILIEQRPKGLLFAADGFRIIADGPRAGWVEFSPMSVAVFNKARGPDGIPDINTIYCDVAYIQFDKPVKSVSELDGRKVVTAELHADPEARFNDPRKGRVQLNNNRKTLDDNDDWEVLTPGPVYYVAEPKPGLPHITTQNAVQMTDHQNTGFPKPDRRTPRVPTVTGLGMKIYLAEDPKAAPKKDGAPAPPPPPAKKDAKAASGPGIDLLVLDTNVEMNLWLEDGADLTGQPPKKKDPLPPPREVGKEVAKEEPKPAAKDGPKPAAKAAPAPEKRLLVVKTNGPFTHDMKKELAHFEKPAVQKPGLVEHVTVARISQQTGQDLLDCEYLDVYFQRKTPPPPAKGKDGAPLPPPKKAADAEEGGGGMEIKLMRAWGETVVITSDSDNLQAIGTELVHDTAAKMTILKGNAVQKVQAVKDGNLIQGSELHMFSENNQVTQAHVFGPGSLGMGEVDPKSGEYVKQATWGDRLVYTKTVENGKPFDLMTFTGKPAAGPAVFLDRAADGSAQRVQANQLKVWLIPSPKTDPKADPKKEPAKKEAEKKEPEKKDAAKKEPGKDDAAKNAKPHRMEATGDVTSTTPDVVVKRADYLNVWFKDVPALTKPPKKEEPKKEEPKKEDPKAGPTAKGGGPPAPPAKTDAPPPPPPPKKRPLIVVAKTLETWVNRDPQGHTELDRAHAEEDVDIHQDPANPGEQGTDINGKTVDMKAYAEGNYLYVTADPANKAKPGAVRFDQLTMFGFDITIDQRSDTAFIKGEGSMEMISGSTLEGKKLEKPQLVTIFWKQKMDFYGAEKLVFYHGHVLAYQDPSKLKCEWMQVILDRPVLLNQAARDKAKAPKPKGGVTEDDNAKIDTIMCFHVPKDDDTPRPKRPPPVVVIEETKEDGKLVKYQRVDAPEVMSVNSPAGPGKTAHLMTATSSETLPGVVRIWQPGTKDDAPEPPKTAPPKTDAPPPKKSELRDDQEMKLTVVQFGGKMQANDFRKRAIFFSNIKVVNLPADTPLLPVDVRQDGIPKGATYLEARDQLEVFTTVQREKKPVGKDMKDVDVSYQEMIARGNVRVRKQGEFFGDADWVSYSELKGVMIFYGTKDNPAEVHRQKGQGIRDEKIQGERIKYFPKTKTFEVEGGTTLSQ